MPIQIGDRELWTPKDVRKEFGIKDSKLRRLSQLNIIPSIPTGSRGDEGEGGPELRLYDEQVLRQLDPKIWGSLTSGIKKPGESRYYSRIRRKAQA